MNNLILTYNNKDFNIEGVPDVKIKKQLNNIGDFSAIKSDITETFDIPKTKNNIIAFDFLGFAGSSDYIAYNTINARLLMEGVEIFHKAKIYAKTELNNYKVILKEGAGNFFDEIEGLYLSDLDTAAIDTIWNKTNIIAYNTNNSGVIYPFIDWGLISQHNYNGIECSELLPGVFYKTLLDYIFDKTKNTQLENLWNYSGSIFTEADFYNLVMPCTSKNFDNIWQPDLLAIAENSIDINLGGLNIADIVSFDDSTFDTFLLIRSTDLNVIQTGAPVTRYVYNVPSDGLYSFSADIRVQIISDSMTILMYKNTDELVSTTAAISNVYTLTATNINCHKGDLVFIEARQSIGFGNVKTPCKFSCTNAEVSTTELGLIFSIANNLPNILQSDVIKEIMQFFGLIADFDSITNTVQFVKFSEITDKVKSFDVNNITDKIDLSNETGLIDNVSNDYSYQSFAKKNFYRWTKDSNDIVVKEDFETNFELTNFNFTGTKDFAVSLFTPSLIHNVSIPATWQVPLIPLLELVETFAGSGVFNVTQKNDIVPRIFKITKSLLSENYTDDNGSTFTSATNIPLCSNLDWSTLKTDYYTEFIRMINIPVTPELSLNFRLADVVNFDIFTPVYIEGLNGYFIVTSLDYNNNGLTNIKLFQIK